MESIVIGSTPKVDVIIPVFNGEKTIGLAIESVLRQPLDLIGKIIVIDDGSTDQTRDVVIALNSPFIHLISKPNEGVAIARNMGIELANSDWVAFLDSDDVWMLNKLPIQIEFAKKYNASFICSNSGNLRSRSQGLISSLSLWKGNFVATSSVLLDRVAAQKIQPFFEPNMKFGEDYLAWFKILGAIDGFYIEKSLVGYYVSPAPHYNLMSVGLHLMNILKTAASLHAKIKNS